MVLDLPCLRTDHECQCRSHPAHRESRCRPAAQRGGPGSQQAHHTQDSRGHGPEGEPGEHHGPASQGGGHQTQVVPCYGRKFLGSHTRTRSLSRANRA
jgi:hypothetical protein